MSVNEKLCPVLLKVIMSWDVTAEHSYEDFDINAVVNIKFYSVMILCAYLIKQPLWHCTAAIYAALQRTVLTIPVLDCCVLFNSWVKCSGNEREFFLVQSWNVCVKFQNI